MGEKKRRLAARQTGPAHQSSGLIAQALEALRRGDGSRAAEMFSELLLTLPSDPDELQSAGVIGIQVGQPGHAEGLLLRAIEQHPDRADYRCNLAIAYRHLGKPMLAIEQLDAALRLDPGLAEVHANLGNLLLESGDIDAAAHSFERALEIRREYPDALNGLGTIQHRRGHYDQACAHFELAVALDPEFHQAHSNLAAARFNCSATLYESSGSANTCAIVKNAQLCIESISTALRICPGNPAYWAQFADCIKHLDLSHPLNPPARDLLLRALDHPAVNPGYLVPPICSLASTHPGALEIKRRLPPNQTFEDVAWPAVRNHVRDVFGDTLLLRILEDGLILDPFLERLIGFSRRATLREISVQPAAAPSLPLQAIAAIALQSFNTEYVYEESTEESSSLDALRSALLRKRMTENHAPLYWYAIYACYRPLHLLEGAEQIAADLAPTPLRALAVRQILEPLEERRLRATILPLTGTAGEVSVSVQAQYEANPYPRWLRTGQNFVPGTVAGILGGMFPKAALDGVVEGPARILIAGCGTGRHPINTVRRFRDSTLLAIDLSLASLAYAKRKTRELGIGNIEYRQGDILALGAIPERFDVIECSGVLHHLEEPLAGWRILCSLLRPGGVMRIGLYSELARRYVVRAREFIAAKGFQPTPDGIRQCRAAILARSDDELLATTVKSEDFYSLSGCRDLIFHVREHRFTLPQVARLIEDLDLNLIGFEFPDAGAIAARYRAQFPDDSALTNLDNWHRYEQAHPDTFARMYQFWVRKRA